MLYNGDNEIIQVYKGANLLDSAHSANIKIWPTALPTEPTVTINPGGTSVQVSAGKYKDYRGREFEFDTPRTLYLNPDGPVPPGSGIVNLPTEYTQYDAPTNRKFFIYNEWETHGIYNYGGGAGLINGNTHHCVSDGEHSQTLAMIKVSVATKEVDRYSSSEVTDSVVFTPSSAARGKIIRVGLTASPRFELYPNGSEIEADISIIYTADGVETVADKASHVYTGGGYVTYPSMSVSATLGLTSTASFKVSVHAKANKGSAGPQGLYGLFATNFTSAFIPGYVDGCYNMGMLYDEYTDSMYLFNMEVTEGTKFGIACVQSGVMISWSKS